MKPLLILSLCSLLLSGCWVLPTPMPGLDVTQNAPSDELAGTEWILTLLNGSPPIEGSFITLAFEEGRLSGSAGCNSYSGSYLLSGNRLQVDQVAVTEMACLEPEGVLEQELAYLEALTSEGSAYRIIDTANGRQLELLTMLNTRTLVFAEKEQVAMNPEDLLNVTWRLADMNGSPPPEGFRPTLVFLNEREFGGFAGCRYYFGSYQASAEEIVFSSMGMLGEDCAANQTLTRQESEFTDYLSQATDYRIGEGRLDLLTARGDQVAFVPVQASEPVTLEGASWRLVGFARSLEPIEPPARLADDLIPGRAVTATFAEGQISGSAGCNRYFAGYTRAGQKLTFSPPGATKMMCATPEGLMMQEQRFLSTLEAVQTFSITGDLLLMDAADGSGLLFARERAD